MNEVRDVPAGVDPVKPAPARIYDYLLSGHNNFRADRDAAERIMATVPEVKDCAWANRGFHQRAARWIAQRGVRQFIDIGSGLPTVGNTHEVVQLVDPWCRVVYVDNDPMVREQAEDLLTEGDLVEVADESDPWGLVAQYVNSLVPGSYLSLSHLTDDQKPPRSVSEFRHVFDHATEQMHFRSRSDVERFFTGLELVSPYQPESGGRLCYAGDWEAVDPVMADSDGSRWLYCGVARRPLCAVIC
jgi:hypothetical protein